METRTITVYNFNELSEDAKQTAISEYIEHGLDYEWYDYIIDNTKEIGDILGIDIDNIYFSGFCSQGSGACFVGEYSYNKGSCKAICERAPQDTELHEIADTLKAIQRKYFYKLWAKVTHTGWYCHSLSTSIDIGLLDSYQNLEPNDAEDLSDTLRNFMDWIYKQLNKEYEYLTNKPVIAELSEAHNWKYNADGSLA